MPHFIPPLACGNVGITNTDIALLFSIAAGWITAFFLSFINVFLILRASHPTAFKTTHSIILMSYVGLAVFLFVFPKFCPSNDLTELVVIVLAIAIPLVAIGHFIYLLIDWRKMRLKAKNDAQPD